MAVVEISVTPLGTAGMGVSKFVAACVDIVSKSGLKYQLTPMGTIIEGDIDVVLAVLRQMTFSSPNDMRENIKSKGGTK